MPYNIKQLGKESVSIEYFIVDPILHEHAITFGLLATVAYLIYQSISKPPT